MLRIAIVAVAVCLCAPAFAQGWPPVDKTGADLECDKGAQRIEDETTRSSWCERDGAKHGAFRQWWADGTLRVSAEYKDGKRTGRRVQYFESGKVEVEAWYEADQLHGKWTRNHENGEPSEIGQFEHDVQAGVWEFFDAAGDRLQTCDFSDGGGDCEQHTLPTLTGTAPRGHLGPSCNAYVNAIQTLCNDPNVAKAMGPDGCKAMSDAGQQMVDALMQGDPAAAQMAEESCVMGLNALDDVRRSLSQP